PNDVQLKRKSRRNVVRKPVLELYPGGREFYYGRYFTSLPASESQAEEVLIDAVALFFRSVIAVALNSKPFDPENTPDARRRILAQIVQRRGQGKFRRRLLQAYKHRCAITGCSIEQILEAVHITPY